MLRNPAVPAHTLLVQLFMYRAVDRFHKNLFFNSRLLSRTFERSYHIA